MTTEQRNTLLMVAIIGFVLVMMIVLQRRPDPVTPQPPTPANIAELPVDDWMSYTEMVAFMRAANEQLPQHTAIFSWGTSAGGKELIGLRCGDPSKPSLIIHGGIHGNEVRGVIAVLWKMRQFCHDFGRDDRATAIWQSRCVYWIPCYNPDSYPSSRSSEGRDPNRDLPSPGNPRTRNVTSKAIMALYRQVKPVGTWSGHTWGPACFIPSIGPSADRQAIREFAQRAFSDTDYRVSQVGSSPAGYDVDAGYWQPDNESGACAVLFEYGHGRSTRPGVAIEEGRTTYPGFLLWCEESPQVAARLAPPRYRSESGGAVLGELIPRHDDDPATAGAFLEWDE